MSIYPYLANIPVREMVVPCDGGHTIYISDRLTHEGQIAAFRHALRHIASDDDFAIGKDVQEIEGKAHR